MISVIISYSSNEKRFIETLVNECLKFSDNVIISAYTTFFDGEKDKDVLNDICLNKNNKVIVANTKP